MKILIATPLLPTQPGGPGQYGYQLSEAFKLKGHTVTTIDFQRVKKFPSGIRHIVLCATFLKAMRGVDVVISLDTVSIALPAVIAARIRGVRSIIRIGGDFVWEHFIERTKQKVRLSEFYGKHISLSLKERVLVWVQKHIIFPLTDTIVFSTTWQRDIWSIPYTIPLTKVCVIENSYAPIEQQKSIHHTSKQVVWIGRELILKNTDTLDSAMIEVQKKYPDVAYKKYSHISHKEVNAVLQNCRMLVIPSVSEVSPNLVFEAFAYSVPVLLTDDCGLHEVLQDVVVWIDALNSTDIAEKIGMLMSEKKYSETVTKIQQSRYTRTYTDIADDFLKLFHE